jgi:predicted RNase H-like nuclease (RuvC/YqgF family)
MLVTLIVGLCIAWYLDRQNLLQKYQANTSSLQRVLKRVKGYENEIQPRLKSLSEKYRPRNRNDDIHYYKNECDELEMEVERARSIYSQLFTNSPQIEIK